MRSDCTDSWIFENFQQWLMDSSSEVIYLAQDVVFMAAVVKLVLNNHTLSH